MEEEEDKEGWEGREQWVDGEVLTPVGQLPTGESYLGAGAKDSHHGYTFQFHLLMLYATKALNLGRKDFKIATEMAHAGKFDDVVFSFPKEGKGSGQCFQFIQAKHTLSQNTKVIRASQLFDRSGGPFSLSKYFDSYREMKQNPDLLQYGDEVQSLIICSNMRFNYGQPVCHFVFEESILSSCGTDEILGNELLKFKDNFGGRREVVLFLKNGCVPLPRMFTNSIMKGQRFALKSFYGQGLSSSLYRSYCKTLIWEVVDLDSMTFRKGFVEDCALSSAGSHFRDELWFRYLDHQAEQKDEDGFRSFLASRVVEVLGDFNDLPAASQISPRALAKSVLDLLVKHRDTRVIEVDESDSNLQKNIEMLLDFVLVRKGGGLAFDPGFLRGKWLPENLNSFRESLRARVGNAGIDFNTLGDYVFKVEHANDMSTRYCGERLEQDVREFLEKLSFALNQPGIAEMEATVKAEVAKFLNVSDASNAYGRFFNEMYSWAESKDARYLTEGDVRRFFVERKKEMTGGIRFNLRHPVVDFVGRDEQLRGIHEVLQGEAGVSRSQIPHAVVLCGLGGIGKSEVAREYAKKHYSSRYDNIIWIDSENSERLESSFKMLAFGRLGILKEDRNGDIKDIEVIVQETYDFFKDKKTLMIFDNVELNDNLSKFFPKFFLDDGGVYVLMTARSRDWKGFPIIDMDNFSSEEALEFVHLSLEHLPNWDEGEANELMKKLSNFPLALKQAVSYIEQMEKNFRSKGKSYRISDYSDLYGKSSEKLLNCPFRKELLNVYSETTYRTMTIALGHLKGSPDGRTAIPILNVMSYLSPDTIETDVLRTAYPRFTTHQVDTSFDLLQKLSILRVEGSRAIIHRLIQSVNKINLKNLGKEEETIYEATRLAEVMDVEHQMSVWESISEHKRLVMAFCRIPGKIAERLSKKLMSTVALEFMSEAIEVLSNHLGPENYETLMSRRNLGRIYYFDGKFEEAVKIQKQILEDQRRVLGKDDPDTFVTMYHYGVTIVQTGKHEESLRIFKEIVDRGTALLGEGHETVWAAKNQIAEILQRLGRKDEKAEDYSKELTAWAQNIVHGSQGKEKHTKQTVKNSQSAKAGEQSLKAEEYMKLKAKKTGHVGQVDFDDLLKAKVILARNCKGEGKYGKAYDYYKSGLEQLEGEYGGDHAKIKKFRLEMSDALIKMGKCEEALTLLRRDNLTKGNIWGNSYVVEHALLTGKALWGEREYEDSIKCFVQCFKPGKGCEELLQSMVMFCTGKIDELVQAKEYKVMILMLQQFYEVVHGDVSAPTHSMRIFDASLESAMQMNKRGDKREALEVLKYVCQSFKCVYGEAGVKTVTAKFLFAQYYCEFGHASALRKGTKYMLEVHRTLCDKIDEGDDEVLDLMAHVLVMSKKYCDTEVFSKVLLATHKVVVKNLGREHPFYLKLKVL